ncbi:aldehyde dehydrogenase [Marinomonas posidonica]|uniref:Salicylaldehyde dehydrogenase n=1 Tax=Marinomonas posidonica (strain CECT 7376 / NCIMB 14433 / IVIA-Po-181) TaxID=491952 RepID=F6CVH2_MARPP|nr:aldehyde dehydrogenase [Marinomonas posidonica]AEF55349.1 Salicylaldehyde dehydrogenase [Marinomonas posidonica IVIA-Po-181]
MNIASESMGACPVPEVNLFVDGQHQPAMAGGYFDRLDPSNDLLASRVACGRRDDAEHMVAIATASFPAWSATQVEERAAILLFAKTLMPKYRDRFAQCMLREIGATQEWVDFNMTVAMDAIDAAVDLAVYHLSEECPEKKPKAASQQCLSHQSKDSYILRKPAGVCLAIAPWNAPIVLGMRAIVFPLAFGNTVILKASELSSGTHVLLAELLHEAGIPNGVVGVMTNASEHSEEVITSLISNPSVRRVNFTGSTRVGRIIASIAAKYLKRCLLELGGKSPLIVLKDANLALAAKEAAYGAFLNQGQICMATDRIIVEQSIADEFIDLLTDMAAQLVAGDPRRKGVKLGPVATPSIASRLSALIEDAIDKGATLLTGASRRGQFIDATLLDHITPMMRIYSEECFGPIAGIYRVDSPEEAITVANNCEYGLAAAVFTNDLKLAETLVNQLESGICHINGATVKDDPFMPFGGQKSSGYGRFGSDACVDEFTEVRWITVNRQT